MTRKTIGIIREGKVPIDRRVPITPEQAKQLISDLPEVDIIVQNSEIRCFSDNNYSDLDLPLRKDVSDADILVGVKEVPINELIPNKTYFFFSHTIKKQDYNKELLQAIVDKGITLIDYELLTDGHGHRVIAFGRYAGIVGAYNGILTYGKRYNLFNLRPAHSVFDLEDLRTEYSKVKLPPIKIGVTGGGRVAKGSMEVLHGMEIKEVTPEELLINHYEYPVFAQLNSRDYHKHKKGDEFTRREFHQHPERFDSSFKDFTKVLDLLIAGAFWNPEAPVLFTREEMTGRDFKIKVIADITCDIEGSIPSTLRPSTIDDPIYDYNPDEGIEEKAFLDESNVTVMAVDNLPCELPRDASRDFGKELTGKVLPALLNPDPEDHMIQRATIVEKGKITHKFQYLKDWLNSEN